MTDSASANGTADLPWDQLWIDARIATMQDNSYGRIEDGAIGVLNGNIAWIGKRSALPGPVASLSGSVHSARGGWITPGLIDCHNHLVFAGTRARDYEMRLRKASRAQIAAAGGGIMQTIRLTQQQSEEQLLQSAQRRLAAFAAEGCTTIEVKSGYGLDLSSELKILRAGRRAGEALNVDVTLTFGVYAVPPELETQRDRYVDFVCQEALPAVAEANLASAIDVQLDEFGFDKCETERMFRAALALGLDCRSHTDEWSDFDGAHFVAGMGGRSVDHAEYASERGIAAMAAAGTYAVLLPGNSHILQRTEVPPVEVMRRHGVRMAVGSNCNPGPSPTTSLLLMMNMACVIHGLMPEEALLGVTTHAAGVLGLDKSRGTLEPGKRADFVVWDIEELSELAYYLGFNPAAMVVARGRKVLDRAGTAAPGQLRP